MITKVEKSEMQMRSKYVVVIVLDIIYEGGDDSCEEPLVPIPNTKVKLTNADNIWLETAREDRKLPLTRRRLRVTSESFFMSPAKRWGPNKTKVLKGRGKCSVAKFSLLCSVARQL